jgi:hypothetical protein
MTRGGPHCVVKDSAHRNTDHANTGGRIRPLRCAGENMIENLEHVFKVANLRFAGWIAIIRGFIRYLGPHLSEMHVEAGISLYHVLEFFENWNETNFWIVFYMVYLSTEPLLLDPTVGRKPGTVTNCKGSATWTRSLARVPTYWCTRCSVGI